MRVAPRLAGGVKTDLGDVATLASTTATLVGAEGTVTKGIVGLGRALSRAATPSDPCVSDATVGRTEVETSRGGDIRVDAAPAHDEAAGERSGDRGELDDRGGVAVDEAAPAE